MDDSIRNTIKQLLGISIDVTAFDVDITVGINSALMELNQLGIGPDSGYVIKGSIETWTDLLGDAINLEAVKTFVYLKTKLVFDPPPHSFQIEAIERLTKDLAWHLVVQREKTI